MSNTVYSYEGLFGSTDHYDETGNSLGYSMPGLTDGSVDHFGPGGEYLGTSYKSFFDTTFHVGADGSDLGYSMPGILGGTDHFSPSGEFAGSTYDGFFGNAYEGSDPDLGVFGAMPPED